jgi:hypothetical protein
MWSTASVLDTFVCSGDLLHLTNGSATAIEELTSVSKSILQSFGGRKMLESAGNSAWPGKRSHKRPKVTAPLSCSWARKRFQ